MAVAGLEFGVLLVRGGLAGRVVGCELGTRGSTGLWWVTVVPWVGALLLTSIARVAVHQ